MMLLNEGKERKPIIIRFFNAHGDEVRQVSIPASELVFFANRIIREELAASGQLMREPFFRITPLSSVVDRTPHPVGATSLYGGRYHATQPPARCIQPRADSGGRLVKFELIDYNNTVFEGHYTYNDLFIHAAQNLLDSMIRHRLLVYADGPYYYEADLGDVECLEAPLIQHQRLRTNADALVSPPSAKLDSGKKFTFTKVVEKPLDIRDPESYGPCRRLGEGPDGPGRIIIHAKVFRELQAEFSFSPSVECGGFLLGKAFRQPDSAEKPPDPAFKWLIEIHRAVQAEESYGNAVNLVFTGGSWSRVNRLLDTQYKEFKIVGWFHTHLFASAKAQGLSFLDHNLHHRFLHRAWQIALLINMGPDRRREVSCFQVMSNGRLTQSPYYVLKEHA